jgi:hypothetical protein
MTQLFFDVECYPNYFLILFKLSNGKQKCFELDETKRLDTILIQEFLENAETIGFNSRMYDIPMILHALSGANNQELKALSDRIINKDEKTYDTLKELGLFCPWHYNHIDLFKLPIGKNSLKMYGARINTTFLQDLPYDPSLPLTEDQKVDIKNYCSNDVNITMDLYKHLEKPLAIRCDINRKYNVEVRSKSDSQIAEVLIKEKLIMPFKPNPKHNFKYTPPDYVRFQSEELTDLLEIISSIKFKGKKGDKIFNEAIPSSVVINDSKYSIGIGGLHSTEKNRAVITQDNEYLIDLDVVSYYPSIILNNEYSPEHLDKKAFIKYYCDIYYDRLEAKRTGDTAKSQVYKIILNGSFGKFGDQYSVLYSPELLIHTTITGQLSLLMLIERLEENGFKVVSANTDGVSVKLQKDQYHLFQKVKWNWEKTTQFELEEVKYKAIYSESVNSYIAIKEDGSLKCKGSFVDNDLAHNPTIKVCKDAILAYLFKGIKIEDTVLNYEPIASNFLMVRKVKGGGYWKGEYLGKVVRWYWSTTGEPILNDKGHKVANSEHAFPIMDLNVPLADIHYEKYISECYELLTRIGVNCEYHQSRVTSTMPIQGVFTGVWNSDTVNPLVLVNSTI